MGRKRERTEYNQLWRDKNRERLRERQREYRRKNRDRIQAYFAEWRKQNRDKLRKYRTTPEAQARKREYDRERYRTDPAYRESAKRRAAIRRERLRSDGELRARERASVRKYQHSPKGILARRRREMEQFGITLEQYDALLKRQRGVCAICRKPETWKGKTGTAHLTVDHCHKTGRVRGLLCRSCNRGLGLLGDTAASLRKALRYLS